MTKEKYQECQEINQAKRKEQKMKSMGNKQRIVDEILPIMLSNYKGNTFVDIFLWQLFRY